MWVRFSQHYPDLLLLRQRSADSSLTTKLDSPLKREVTIQGEPYTLTISPERLHLARKGRRKGYELAWADLISGDAALATALNASLSLSPGIEPAAKSNHESGAAAAPKSGSSRPAPKKSR